MNPLLTFSEIRYKYSAKLLCRSNHGTGHHLSTRLCAQRVPKEEQVFNIGFTNTAAPLSDFLSGRLRGGLGLIEVNSRHFFLVIVSMFLFVQCAALIPIYAGQSSSAYSERNGLAPKARESLSSSWLSGWNFRKAHAIIGSAGAGTNYQIEIITHYGSGNDSGPDVYCNHNCQPSFDDIRFTGDDGVSLLHFWREEAVSSNHAVFWVRVPENLSQT